MDVNENEFFRLMTLRICGSLDMELALKRSFEFLRRYIPLDTLSLHLYYPETSALHTLAEVSDSETKKLARVYLLDKRGRQSLEDDHVPNIRIVNNTDEDPVIDLVRKSLNLRQFSALVLRLMIDGQRIGSLALTKEGAGIYTEKHARLLSILNDPFAIALANSLTHQEVIRLRDIISDENKFLRQEVLNIYPEEIIGSDFGLKGVMEMVRKVAPLESPVLLLGETGVGKGILAGAIHHLSGRSKGPFITVNSGAIPDTLIDSELFGHEKGAFTGAVGQKRGRFERANSGTIFLDEIGELPPQAQVRMLRVLQERVIERVGGSEAIPVDIRIIAATHRNLDEMVRTGQFREDLLFRINVFPIRIPSLRERKEDVSSLVYYSIKKKSRELKLPAVPMLAAGAMERLMSYEWPGNVRELENVVEREIILNRQGPLTFNLLARRAASSAIHALSERTDGTFPSLEEVSVSHIRRALDSASGIIHGPQGAARLLGINPSTLRSRMKKLGMTYSKPRK
jgi:transcriptional regulator with GAF, ATPase, and Fis domain